MDGRKTETPFRRASVIGPTAWGTTLAILLARNGIETALITRTEAECLCLSRAGEHSLRLPGVPFPPTLHVTAGIGEAVSSSDLVVIAVPSQTVRANVRSIRDAYADGAVVVSGVKGLELGTGSRMSQVIAEELQNRCDDRVVVLSGPNLSREVAKGLPASTVAACNDLSIARQVQTALMSPTLRIYSHTDVIGVELGGALKNIIAIGAGMGDGLGYGANAKAAFLTRGLMEITRLGIALGANPSTFTGLAGMGDLVATSISSLSRNRRLGEAIGRGEAPETVRAQMHEVAEGVDATSVALLLARRTKVEMPITEMTARVLFEGLDPSIAVKQLMTRDAKEEMLAAQ